MDRTTTHTVLTCGCRKRRGPVADIGKRCVDCNRKLRDLYRPAVTPRKHQGMGAKS